MPTLDAVPSVPLSFSNNFWGMEEKGVVVLFQRMREAKQTCDEVKSFYKERMSIEEDYAKRLLALSRKSLGSGELGSLRASLDTVRSETEQMGKAHANTAMQIRTELEEPLSTFATGMRERRKVVQVTLDKLAKAKAAQQAAVAKNRDRYENDCNKINGYIAQQNMVMGRELERNNAKLEKTQIAVTASRREYQTSLRNLADTTEKWNREWKAGCDKFQDLEEERIDYLKGNLWAYTNIVSTVCVSDDELCENIRLSLEKCEIESDIVAFIKERGTGQEIPDPPRYINFMDGSSGYSPEHDNYTLAQFPRQVNPQFRTSAQPVEHIETQETSRAEYDTAKRNPLDGVVLPYRDDALSSAHSSPQHRPVSPSESVASSSTSISSGPDNELDTTMVKTPTKQSTGWTSPFRRKTEEVVREADVERTPSYGNKLTPKSAQRSPSARSIKSMRSLKQDEFDEPVDPRASVMMNIGSNSFDLTPRKRSKTPVADDPIAAALASLKNNDSKEQKYAGLGTTTSRPGRRVPSYSAPSSPQHHATERPMEVPPPAHRQNQAIRQPDFGQSRPGLAPPAQAVTSASIRQTANEYATRTREVFEPRRPVNGDTRRPESRHHESNMRAGYASASPDNRSPIRQEYRQASPRQVASSRQGTSRQAESPTRPRSAYGYAPEQRNIRPELREVQQVQQRPVQHGTRGALYDRQKSKSALDLRRPQEVDLPTHSMDGRPVVAYARAMYDYKASIPEEEDGWWEAEVFGPRSRPQYGLAPGNFCQML